MGHDKKSTQDLILEYKDEFDFWLSGGTIIYKQHNTEWRDDTSPFPFEFPFPWQIKHIVKNDKMVLFRKALCDGERVEFTSTAQNGDKEGEKLSSQSEIDGCEDVSNLRINPNKFSIDDWVKINSNGKIFQIDVIDANGWCISRRGKKLLEHYHGLTLWSPSKKDPVWYKNRALEWYDREFKGQELKIGIFESVTDKGLYNISTPFGGNLEVEVIIPWMKELPKEMISLLT